METGETSGSGLTEQEIAQIFGEPDDSLMTVEKLREVLPKNLQGAHDQNLVDKLNQISDQPQAARIIRENFIGFSHILNEGKFKSTDYISAVAYVSYKHMGLTNQRAWELTFPERYQNLVAEGKLDNISAYVSAYHRGKLVSALFEQSLLPGYLLFQDVYYESITKLATLMRTSTSDRIQMESANSLMAHLAKPEKKEIALDVNVNESEGIQEMKQAMAEMAELQRQRIASGDSPRQIAAHDLMGREKPIEEAEFTDVDKSG